jgi:drug/metabolite transporter (DMT)-like permease
MVGKEGSSRDASCVETKLEGKKPRATGNTTRRAYRLLALVLVLRPFGNVSLAWEMKHFSQVLSINPFMYVRAMLNPFVALGVAMLVLALLTRRALLSLADLSFVVPLTALGYIFSTLLGKLFLSEYASPWRWLGTLSVFLGAVIVGSTTQKTGKGSEPSKTTDLLQEIVT